MNASSPLPDAPTFSIAGILPHAGRSPLYRYLVAFAAVVLATLIRWVMNPVLGDRHPFLCYFVAVTIAAWHGGSGPAIFALSLGAVGATYFFVEPGQFLVLSQPVHLLGLLLYLFVGLTTALLSQFLHSARARAEREREGLAREVAERQRTTSALRDEEALRGAILQSALDALISIDHQGRVLEFNPAAERIFGFRRDEALGQLLADLIIPADQRQAHQRGLARYLETGEGPVLGQRIEVQARRRDGSLFPVELAITPIARQGHPVFTAYLRDITDRKRAEDDLRRSEERYRTFIQQSTEGIWRFELEEPIRVDLPESSQIDAFFRACYLAECNDAMARMYGYHSASEILGKRLGDLLPRDDPRNIAYLDRFIRSGYRLSEAESYEVDRQGRPRYFLNNLVAIVERNHLVRAWGTQRDITDRQLAEIALREAKESAEAANRAKDRFLAVLSHELRTPLTPVLLSVTALLDGPIEGTDPRPVLEMIRRNVELEARLIDDLLDLVRITRGRMVYRPEQVDAHDLIARALEICRDDLLELGHTLDLDLAAADHHVQADPARLQQVFWNLIKNAVKFTPRGGRLSVRSFNDGDQLVVEVSDSGVGIEPDALPRIFDAFEQAERSSASRRFGGLGLGLAISRAVVEAHGGTLAARSEGCDRGSTFTVRLHALANPSSSLAATPRAADTPARTGRLRVLIVEDDPTTLRLMARILTGFRFAVTTADSLAAALQALEQGEFDLLVSDIGLPDGTGLDLMRRVRPHHRFPGIALTGFGMDEDVRRSLDAGFAAHLTKPISVQLLETTIREVISDARVA